MTTVRTDSGPPAAVDAKSKGEAARSPRSKALPGGYVSSAAFPQSYTPRLHGCHS